MGRCDSLFYVLRPLVQYLVQVLAVICSPIPSPGKFASKQLWISLVLVDSHSKQLSMCPIVIHSSLVGWRLEQWCQPTAVAHHTTQGPNQLQTALESPLEMAPNHSPFRLQSSLETTQSFSIWSFSISSFCPSVFHPLFLRGQPRLITQGWRPS